MNKLFSFRWDIDHRACMTDGVPLIRDLCDQFGVPNTFFVNMGRSTNLREWLGKGLKGSKEKMSDMQAINLIQKIGWPRFILETLIARPVGRSFVPQLQQLQRAGHELGLHGGGDHVVWSRRFKELPEHVIRADVLETLEFFECKFGKPAGFTSPGFKSDERVMKIVDDLGFKYNGDSIGGVPQLARSGDQILSHWNVPVTICGPRTIPFLERHGAIGTDQDTIMSALDSELDKNGIAIFYGHPCYEGVHVELLRKIFERVLDHGYAFVTHAEIARRMSEQSLQLH